MSQFSEESRITNNPEEDLVTVKLLLRPNTTQRVIKKSRLLEFKF